MQRFFSLFSIPTYQIASDISKIQRKLKYDFKICACFSVKLVKTNSSLLFIVTHFLPVSYLESNICVVKILVIHLNNYIHSYLERENRMGLFLLILALLSLSL